MVPTCLMFQDFEQTQALNPFAPYETSRIKNFQL
jgi:hypothetical protein